MVTMAGGGNPEGTWEALGLTEPRQHHHTCLINPGMETSLNDDCVFACSRWDPVEPRELVQLRIRRAAAYPEPDRPSWWARALRWLRQPSPPEETLDDDEEGALDAT
jgi:hypothetical protein